MDYLGKTEQNFGEFDYSTPGQNYGGYEQQPTSYPEYPSVLHPDTSKQSTTDDFIDEPPLLEELGINFDHILQKTLSVMNPFRMTDPLIMQDTDMAGPLVFCLTFGGLLLLSGKVHFSFVYGFGALGCMGMYFLLNMMSHKGVSFGIVVSVLGYCLLPMVAVAAVSILSSLKGTIGMIIVGVAISWCCISASKLFVTALNMDHQQPLVAYPCALLYGTFALLTVF